MKTRVVFDCMVYLQGAGRVNGPAAACLRLADTGQVELCVSAEVLAEVQDVLTRPKTRKRFPTLTAEVVEEFLNRVGRYAIQVDPVPELARLGRDPKDVKYLNLAIAASAKLLVSWDNDLLDLMTGTDADAVAFRTANPDIAILDPVAFLRTLPLGDSSRTRPDEAP